jgi:hypothetical protein
VQAVQAAQHRQPVGVRPAQPTEQRRHRQVATDQLGGGRVRPVAGDDGVVEPVPALELPAHGGADVVVTGEDDERGALPVSHGTSRRVWARRASRRHL